MAASSFTAVYGGDGGGVAAASSQSTWTSCWRYRLRCRRRHCHPRSVRLPSAHLGLTGGAPRRRPVLWHDMPGCKMCWRSFLRVRGPPPHSVQSLPFLPRLPHAAVWRIHHHSPDTPLPFIPTTATTKKTAPRQTSEGRDEVSQVGRTIACPVHLFHPGPLHSCHHLLRHLRRRPLHLPSHQPGPPRRRGRRLARATPPHWG